MLDKVKENINKIIFVLAIVAGAVLIPSVFQFFNTEFTDYTIVYLAYYVLLIAANVVIAIFAYKNKAFDQKTLAIPLFLLMAALILTRVYAIYNDNQLDFASIPFIALYAGIIIIYLASLMNKKLNVVLYILLIILAAMYLVNVFGGSVISLSILITLILVIYNAYNLNREEMKNE